MRVRYPKYSTPQVNQPIVTVEECMAVPPAGALLATIDPYHTTFFPLRPLPSLPLSQQRLAGVQRPLAIPPLVRPQWGIIHAADSPPTAGAALPGAAAFPGAAALPGAAAATPGAAATNGNNSKHGNSTKRSTGRDRARTTERLCLS